MKICFARIVSAKVLVDCTGGIVLLVLQPLALPGHPMVQVQMPLEGLGRFMAFARVSELDDVRDRVVRLAMDENSIPLDLAGPEDGDWICGQGFGGGAALPP